MKFRKREYNIFSIFVKFVKALKLYPLEYDQKRVFVYF